jgi:GNAT superfamily N-acetyltransferase
MNLQESIDRIKQVMGLNESFEKIIKDSNNMYNIKYTDGNEVIGEIRGGIWKNYLTVEHIYLTPNFRSKGHSLTLYKDALELAKQKGLDGLMVGGQLLDPLKTLKTYEHFKYHKSDMLNQYKEPYIILTNFIG